MKRLSDGPYPKIFPSSKKRYFAKLYPEYKRIQEELKEETGIEFDLIYAPLAWMQMIESLHEYDGEILYVHTGGLSGNPSMLERYAFNYQVR